MLVGPLTAGGSVERKCDAFRCVCGGGEYRVLMSNIVCRVHDKWDGEEHVMFMYHRIAVLWGTGKVNISVHK